MTGSAAARTLQVLAGTRVVLFDAPAGFGARLEPLPPGAAVVPAGAGNARTAVLFATDLLRLRERLPAALATLGPGGVVWVAWPRPGGAVPSRLHHGLVRQVMVDAGLVPGGVGRLDDDWAVLRAQPHPERAVVDRPDQRI